MKPLRTCEAVFSCPGCVVKEDVEQLRCVEGWVQGEQDDIRAGKSAGIAEFAVYWG